MLLIFGKTDGIHEIREYEEMNAHDVAYKIIQNKTKQLDEPLTEIFIRQLNEIILVRPFWKEAITPEGQATRREIKIGEYKKHSNSVRLQNGEIFNYASPTDTPIKMGEILEWYNKNLESKEMHPVALAALLHYKFVCIHPFDDGNGRVSRLLMNYVLLKSNLPPIIIKTTDKKNYLNALNQADVGNIDAFIKYIGKQVLWSIVIVTKTTKGENIDEDDDLDKEISILLKESKSKKSIKLPRSKDLQILALENNVFEIFKNIDSKYKLLEEEFNFYLRRINCLFSNNTQYINEDNSIFLEEDFRKIRNKINENENEVLNQINFELDYKGYKKNIESDSIYFQLKIVFELFKFKIELDNNSSEKFLFPYGYNLSNNEKKTIGDIGIKYFIEQFKAIKIK